MNPQVPLSLSTRGNPGIFIVVEANEFLLSAIHPAADPPSHPISGSSFPLGEGSVTGVREMEAEQGA
ncbi:hypothetical protein CgunFtcFv8_009025 [Champsocephalus gunnari]|uniref:Uncharacterized protein n=1 Tax=Champsocephalus gunnari TaxID=52237 RepID=A0AAN8D1B9_CHAGU|nr:hypothetical protein CgunFtcFv8_009025 [Champsocephalus gunnari]